MSSSVFDIPAWFPFKVPEVSISNAVGDTFVSFLNSAFFNIRTSLLTLNSIQISVMKILLLISLVSSPEYISLQCNLALNLLNHHDKIIQAIPCFILAT